MVGLSQELSQKIAAKFLVKDNTLFRDIKNDAKDKISIEIGDSKQVDFKPQVKIMRWENEVNFSLRAEEHPDAVVETEGKVIKYKTPDFEVHQYEIDPGNIGEDGGLEFEWILPSKPSTNILSATIQTKELNFFYQPKLSADEIVKGYRRPDNVIGSYAVYHKTKGCLNLVGGMEYKVGKAFHIYRPKAIDSNNVETWCNLFIDESEGKLEVTIPEVFLNEATYPIRVDPTFGYTSAGASVSAYGDDTWRGAKGIPISSGSVDSLSVYTKKFAAGTAQCKPLLADSSGNIVTNGVGPAITGIPTTPNWYTSNYVSKPTVTGSTTYYPGMVSGGSGVGIDRYFDTAGAVSGDERVDTTNSYSSPTAPTDFSNSTAFISIYATYTASAPITFITSRFPWAS